MTFGLSLVTPPTEEPVSVSLAKQQARILTSDDNELVSLYIKAARQYCETFTRRQFCTATWNLSLDGFPPFDRSDCAPLAWHRHLGEHHARMITLPLCPVQSVSSIKYLDLTGTLQTLDPSAYYVDSSREPVRIVPTPGSSWPATYCVPGAVTVQFVAGYGAAADVPATIRRAIAELTAHAYEQRSASSELTISQVPFSVESLLLSERWGQYP